MSTFLVSFAFIAALAAPVTAFSGTAGPDGNGFEGIESADLALIAKRLPEQQAALTQLLARREREQGLTP